AYGLFLLRKTAVRYHAPNSEGMRHRDKCHYSKEQSPITRLTSTAAQVRSKGRRRLDYTVLCSHKSPSSKPPIQNLAFGSRFRPHARMHSSGVRKEAC